MTRSLVFFASVLTAIIVSGCFEMEMPDKVVFDAEGVWCDDVSDLCWQNPAGDQMYTANAASDYCDELILEGYSDWRLPVIQELISLLRSCVEGIDTEDLSTSECGVTDPGCLGYECNASGCESCDNLEGPDSDSDGCYWDPALWGQASWYWSSSSNTDDSNFAWYVEFNNGNVACADMSYTTFVRCVRDGPDADTDTDTDTDSDTDTDAGALTK